MFYNPSKAESSHNYSHFKNSSFADQSIKKILRASTIKEYLTKTKGNKSTVSVNKRKKETFRS